MTGNNDEAIQGSRGKLHSEYDQAVINELLNDLPCNDRQALLRFYVHGQPNDEIEAALGLSADHFRELRQFFKAAFFTRTGRGC